MSQQLYRQKNLEQISSPDHLTDYLRVTGPGVWLVLSGIILMLAGLLVWGTFGTIMTTVTVPANVENGTLSCYVKAGDLNTEEKETIIRIGDVQMKASSGEMERGKIMDNSDDPALYGSGYLQQGQVVTILRCECPLEDGFYEADVTTKTLHPISFLFEK